MPEEAANPQEEVKEEVKTEPEVAEKEASKEETKPEGEDKEEKPTPRWYIIQALTGHENRVKASIEKNVVAMNLQDRVFRVLIPEEETVEIRGSKRVEKTKKMYPGYVFIEMVLDDEVWYTIRRTPGVAKFIGSKIKPTPVTDLEMQRVLKQLGLREEKIEVAFEKGEIIRIISGPFRGHTGTVDDVNAARSKLKTLVSIFGRDTPVEVDFDQAEKVV